MRAGRSPRMSLRREEFGEEIGASEYVFQFPSGAKRPVRLRVGKPYFVADGEWACPIELNGFEPRHPDIRGADSMQSLCLAISLVRARLEDFLAKGGKVLHMDGSECDPQELWATLGR